MEKNSQQITQKPILPTKTKIAAWWMVIFGLIFLGYQVSILYPSYRLWKEYGELGVNPLYAGAFPILFNALIFLLPGIFLFKRRKMAWHFAAVILIFILMGGLFMFGVSIFQEGFYFLDKFTATFYLFVIILFILLILDRKNFWKIAT